MARRAKVERKTRETQIPVEVDLDGTGHCSIDTPLPFLSHMMEQIGRHGAFDLTIEATGDTEIDGHHTTEDLGEIVFALVDCGILIKQDDDRREDFRDVYDFEETFEQDYPWAAPF